MWRVQLGLTTKLCSQSICCCGCMDILQWETPKNETLIPFRQFPHTSPYKLSLSLSLSSFPWFSFLFSDLSSSIYPPPSPLPFPSSSPLFIGFLSGLVMIILDGFSCKWGPLGLFLEKRGSYFGNGCVSVGTCDRCQILFN